LTHRADGSPLVKVLDFGLSKPTRPDSPSALDQSLTAANTVLGSPHYMSPEQIRCLKDIDGRTDVWSLGVILYQLLSGRRPFQADSMAVMFIIIAADPPAPLSVHRPDLPPSLVDVVMRCLEKDVSKRVQSVRELARSLAPFGTESAWVSVERISRVLAEVAPSPRQTLAPISGGIESTMAMAKTI